MPSEFRLSRKALRLGAVFVLFLSISFKMVVAEEFEPPFSEPRRSIDPFEHFGIQDSPYRQYHLGAYGIEGVYDDDFTMAVAKHALAEAKVFVVVQMYVGFGTTTDNNCEVIFQAVTHMAIQIVGISDILFYESLSAPWIDMSERADPKLPSQREFSIVPTETIAVPLVRYLSRCNSVRDSTKQIEDDWNALRLRYASWYEASFVLKRVRDMLNATTLEVLSNE